MILIAGLPRSGTTWVGKTFDSHPDTLYRHEPDSTHKSRALPLLIGPERFDEVAGEVRKYVDFVLAKTDSKTSGRTPCFPKSYYGPMAYRTRKALVSVSKLADRVGASFDIPDFVDFREHDGLRLVWKSVESLGRAAAIARQFPHCHVVHVVRHPCGRIASELRGRDLGEFGGGLAAPNEAELLDALLKSEPLRTRGVTREQLGRFDSVERLCWHWLAVNEMAMTELGKLPNAVTVTYESLCDQPIEGFKRLFASCKLEWCDQTEAFVRSSTEAEDTAYYSIEKIPTSAAMRWRKELAADQVRQIMEITMESAPGRLFGTDSDPCP